MNLNLDEQLTPNFKLREVVEWPKRQRGMNAADRQQATLLAIANMTPQLKDAAKKVALELEIIRAKANAAFPEYGGKIGIVPLSWYRPREWEIYRKRSGNSQHVHAHAVDFIVDTPGTQDDPIQIEAIMQHIWKHLQDWPGGLAIKYDAGLISFIHIDLRPFKARWTY
jgi:hypothetical protein